jgi:hypothetical protein
MGRTLVYRIVLSIALTLSLFGYASEAQSRRMYDVKMSVQDMANGYARWEMAHNRPHQGEIMLPMLEIYSPDGTLIYHGGQNDTGRAAQVLDSLPALPSSPPSLADKMSLSEMLDMTPDLAKYKSTILNAHHFVVISLSMQGDWKKSNAYTEQNHAVDSIPKRQGVNLDVVRINLSFPQN